MLVQKPVLAVTGLIALCQILLMKRPRQGSYCANPDCVCRCSALHRAGSLLAAERHLPFMCLSSHSFSWNEKVNCILQITVRFMDANASNRVDIAVHSSA